MAYACNPQTFTREAGADLSSSQYYFVKLNSDSEAVLCGNGEQAAGILQNKPEEGESASIAYAGVSMYIGAGSLAAGQAVASSTDGKGEAVSANDKTMGQVVENPGGDGQTGTCLILNTGGNPGDAAVNDVEIAAGEALTSDINKVMTLDATGRVVKAGAGEATCGVLQNAPALAADATLRTAGLTDVVCGATVTAGNTVAVDATARVVAVNPNVDDDYVIGIMRESGTVGESKLMLITNWGITPGFVDELEDRENFVAKADYQLLKGYVLKADTVAGKAILCGQGETPIGVLVNTPDTNEVAYICLKGVVDAVLGGTVAIGDPLSTNVDGQVIVAEDNAPVIGRALEVGTIGTTKSILFAPEKGRASFVDTMNLEAKADYRLLAGYALKVDSTGDKAILAGDGEGAIGILVNSPNINETAQIRMLGKATCVSGAGAIATIGARVAVAAGGKIEIAASGNQDIGYALSTTSGADEALTIMVCPLGIEP